MKAEPIAAFRAAARDRGTVLHLVGRITDAVFSFLGPATAALADQGYAQILVFIDDPRLRHSLGRFDASIRRMPVPADPAGGSGMKELLDAFRDAAIDSKPAVAHLHGVVCSAVGLYASRMHHVDVPMYFTPHGSKSLVPSRSFGSAWPWVLKKLSRGLGDLIIASTRFEADSLREITQRYVHLIESPVAAPFFDAKPVSSETPTIVTAQRSDNERGAESFTQCAVLLADQIAGLRFDWLGRAGSDVAEQLQAAQVHLMPLDDDDDARAAALGRASIFMAPDGGFGFPVFLAEAMTLGLPCIAWDTPYHRDLLRDGETGFLCRDTGDALERLAQLLGSAPLRQRIGQAARAEARERFHGARFRAALLDVYAGATAARGTAG